MKYAVIVTGLPASGKTTVGRDLSKRLGLDFLDKDDFLEDLYDREGVASWDHRKRLSRRSDAAFQEAAKTRESAVLVSHWRPPHRDVDSGTPSDWLQGEYGLLVEVWRRCAPEEALRRFLTRTRHPGHLDKECDAEELAERFGSWSDFYPLRVGRLLEVRTDADVSFQALAEDVRNALTPRG